MYRVLAIDDDPSILRGYKSLFGVQRDASVDALLELDEEAQTESLQYKPFELEVELDITSSGESGYELVRTAVEEGNPYAVIYLDMRMPGRWDGIATAREIRSLDQNVRIIVITAYTENLESLHEIIGNAFVYLKKPFMSEELLQMTRFLAEDWQLARQLQHTVNDVVEAETAKNQFLSMISHEMRTPITTILGNGELLASYLETEETRSLLQSMERAARQLHEHFNDLLEASQLHANMVEFDTHPFDLSQLLEQLQTHHRQQEGGRAMLPIPSVFCWSMTHWSSRCWCVDFCSRPVPRWWPPVTAKRRWRGSRRGVSI
jgi:signal transduction histidine kinase